MIDSSKCKYRDSAGAPWGNALVLYFTYPKDFSEAVFEPEENYGNVVSMCVALSLTKHGGGFDSRMMMSPTVEDGDSIMDVDWVRLEDGRNYTEDTVYRLMRKAGGWELVDLWIEM